MKQPTEKERKKSLTLDFILTEGFIPFNDKTFLFPNNHHSSLIYNGYANVTLEYIRFDINPILLKKTLKTVGDLWDAAKFVGDDITDDLPF